MNARSAIGHLNPTASETAAEGIASTHAGSQVRHGKIGPDSAGFAHIFGKATSDQAAASKPQAFVPGPSLTHVATAQTRSAAKEGLASHTQIPLETKQASSPSATVPKVPAQENTAAPDKRQSAPLSTSMRAPKSAPEASEARAANTRPSIKASVLPATAPERQNTSPSAEAGGMPVKQEDATDLHAIASRIDETTTLPAKDAVRPFAAAATKKPTTTPPAEETAKPNGSAAEARRSKVVAAAPEIVRATVATSTAGPEKAADDANKSLSHPEEQVRARSDSPRIAKPATLSSQVAHKESPSIDFARGTPIAHTHVPAAEGARTPEAAAHFPTFHQNPSPNLSAHAGVQSAYSTFDTAPVLHAARTGEQGSVSRPTTQAHDLGGRPSREPQVEARVPTKEDGQQAKSPALPAESLKSPMAERLPLSEQVAAETRAQVSHTNDPSLTPLGNARTPHPASRDPQLPRAQAKSALSARARQVHTPSTSDTTRASTTTTKAAVHESSHKQSPSSQPAVAPRAADPSSEATPSPGTSAQAPLPSHDVPVTGQPPLQHERPVQHSTPESHNLHQVPLTSPTQPVAQPATIQPSQAKPTAEPATKQPEHHAPAQPQHIAPAQAEHRGAETTPTPPSPPPANAPAPQAQALPGTGQVPIHSAQPSQKLPTPPLGSAASGFDSASQSPQERAEPQETSAPQPHRAPPVQSGSQPASSDQTAPPAPTRAAAPASATISQFAPAPASHPAGTKSDKGKQLDPESESDESVQAQAASSATAPVPTSPRHAPIDLQKPKTEAAPLPQADRSTDNLASSRTEPATAPREAAASPDTPVVIVGDRSALFSFPVASQAAFGGPIFASDLPSASSAPTEHAQILEHAGDDPGLTVSVLPHAAHLSIVSTSGDLALHVRVRDGNTDVNISGSMAPLFESKAPEVRTVLATEGLHLGSFATNQQGGQDGQSGQQGQPEPSATPPANQPASAHRRAAATSPEVRDISEKGIHVTA